MATKLKPLTKAELRTLASLQKRDIANSVARSDVYKEFETALAAEAKTPIPSADTYRESVAPPDGVQATLDERGTRYGDFTDHARLAQQLQDAMRFHCVIRDGEPYYPWNHLTPVMKQALQVDCDKNARILNGDPTYADNWHDKQGYAKLVEDRLVKV